MASITALIAERHTRPSANSAHCGCGQHVPTASYAQHIVEATRQVLEEEFLSGRMQVDHDIQLLNSVLGLRRDQVLVKIDELLDVRPWEALLEEEV